MDILSQVSDPLLFESSSSLPDACSSTAPPRQAAHLDVEEVLLATSRQKKRSGRRIFEETRHPIFRGVRRRNNNKWVSELREPIKKKLGRLGAYPTPEMAARAHDVVALALRGKSACLNFADSAWRLPLPDSTDIRKATAEVAEEFRPRADEMEVRHVEESDVKLKEVENTLQESKVLPENVFYMEEEAVFDMPGLLVNMAEGIYASFATSTISS